MKIFIVIDKKKKSQETNNYDYDNFNISNGKKKPRSPKFISFSWLKNQNIWNDLQFQL